MSPAAAAPQSAPCRACVRSGKTVCFGSATRSVLFPLGQGFFAYAIAISCSDRQQLAGASAGGAGWPLQVPGRCSRRVLARRAASRGAAGGTPRAGSQLLALGWGEMVFCWHGTGWSKDRQAIFTAFPLVCNQLVVMPHNRNVWEYGILVYREVLYESDSTPCFLKIYEVLSIETEGVHHFRPLTWLP